MFKKSQTYIVAAIVIVSMAAALPGIAQKVKLNPIKPTASQPITDEQQGIMAVRMVKPAVVNIIGASASPAPSASSGNGPTITPYDFNEVDGTGFIIDADGLIVSNNHVVQDVNLKYTVVFADGTQYDAKVLGLDKYADVALLKIEAHNLPVAKLGDSDALETGQSVFAIGNSLGRYQNTVTKGVVSGLGRSVTAGTSAPMPRLQQLIQTDAAINPGNSGGPLITLAGEVVGMNTLIDTEGAGLGFAIPVNTIKDDVSQIKQFGKVSRPFVGVQFATIDRAFLAAHPLSTKQGAYVAEVVEGSPAQAAGLKLGDVITEINREKLTEINELDKVVSRYPAGTQILISYVRNEQTVETFLILAEYK